MPRPLNFHPRWIEPILAHGKHLTVRRSGSGYRPGDHVKAMRRNHPAFAELVIERVETVRLDALTRRQAQLDGHADVDELRSALQRLYPGQEEFDVITFRVV